MATAKKTVKKVKEVLSDEDKILGKTAELKTIVEVNYESPERKYKVTNLILKNNPIIVTGDLIESFIGTGNLEQRNELKKGAVMVITKDGNNTDAHKIELIKD